MLSVQLVTARRLALGCGVAFAAGVLLASSSAAAFSDPAGYAVPPEEGGGGGRWFTGSPADGYSCDVCHEGGEPVELQVAGLPLDGFLPGQPYEITVRWPLSAPNVSLVAEFSDDNRRGLGSVRLPNLEKLQQQELCAGELAFMVPPSQVFEAEGGRMLVSTLDCGAQLTRFQWTAPAVATDGAWFNLGFVSSDESGEPQGDGVTLVQYRLSASGSQNVTIAEGCSSIPGRKVSAFAWVFFASCSVSILVRARRGSMRASNVGT